MTGRHSCLFLDRDGVILEQSPRKYVKSIWDAHFQSHSLAALTKAPAEWDMVIVVTNQAGVAYGYTTLKDQNEINSFIADSVANRGKKIHAFFMCTHSKEEGCACRKPGTLFFERAAELFDIDLSRSCMVGDMLTDLEAARAAGVQPVLVLSGHGVRSLCELIQTREEYGTIWNSDVLVARDLYSFVTHDLVLPLSVYAETTPPPCKEVAHSDSKRIQAALQTYFEAIRKAVSLSRTPGL